MFYVSKPKSEAVGADEYSAVVMRVADAAPYLAEGYVEATRGEWEAVQSDEVKARIAAGDAEFNDEAPANEAGEVVAEEVVA